MSVQLVSISDSHYKHVPLQAMQEFSVTARPNAVISDTAARKVCASQPMSVPVTVDVKAESLAVLSYRVVSPLKDVTEYTVDVTSGTH